MTFKLGHLNFFSLKGIFFTFVCYIVFFNYSIFCETVAFYLNFTQTWMIDMGRSLMFDWFRLELGYLFKFIKSSHTGNSILVVLKFCFLITVLATRSNIPSLSIFSTNGTLISVLISLITASASGPSAGIFFPCFLYVFLKRPISSAVEIGFLFLSSLALSRK